MIICHEKPKKQQNNNNIVQFFHYIHYQVGILSLTNAGEYFDTHVFPFWFSANMKTLLLNNGKIPLFMCKKTLSGKFAPASLSHGDTHSLHLLLVTENLQQSSLRFSDLLMTYECICW